MRWNPEALAERGQESTIRLVEHHLIQLIHPDTKLLEDPRHGFGQSLDRNTKEGHTLNTDRVFASQHCLQTSRLSGPAGK